MSAPTEPPIIKFQCPHCQTRLTVPLDACGKESPCPECAQSIVAPEIVGTLAAAPAENEAPSGQRTLKVRRVAMGDRAAHGKAGRRQEIRVPKPGEPSQSVPTQQFLPKPGDPVEPGRRPPGPPSPAPPTKPTPVGPRVPEKPMPGPPPAALGAAPAAPPRPALPPLPVEAAKVSLPPAPLPFQPQPQPAAVSGGTANPVRISLPAPVSFPPSGGDTPPLLQNPFVPAQSPALSPPPIPPAQAVALAAPPSSQAAPVPLSRPTSAVTYRNTTSGKAAPRKNKRYWNMLLKSAAAIVTLGLIVFLKLDRLAESWYGPAWEEAHAVINPTIRQRPQPKGPARIIDSLSLREQFVFKASELLAFPDLNCRFHLPEDAWQFALDPWSREGTVFSLDKIAEAPAAGRQDINEAFFTLRVLPVGPEGTDQNHAAAAAQTALRALGGCRIRGREEVVLSGLVFSRIEVEELPFRFGRANAEVWLYSLNGMVYEMITAMPARTPPYYLSLAARRLAEGFSIIDPSKRLRSADVLALLETSGAVPVSNASAKFGNVFVNLKPEIWSTWPGARNTLPGNSLAFASRGGLRLAAAFAPAEGLPEDPERTASLIAAIWPALRDFQWGRMDKRPHQGLSTAVLRGSGTLNSRSGIAEVRAVRAGQSFMLLFAFGPGDARPAALTANLDLFQVEPGANGDPDFGIVEEREFHRNALSGFAEDATANGRHEEASRYHRTLFEWDRRPDDLCNACRSLAAAGKKDDALRLLMDQEGKHAGQPDWEVQKMILLASIGQAEESRRVAAALLQSGGLAAAAAAVYVETLIDAKEFRHAQPFVKLLTELDQSPVWHLYHALLLAETGERGKASKLIRAVRTADPHDVELSVECVHVLMRCRLFPEALELARFLAVKNPQREQLQILAAACHTALGHTTEARDAYQRILAANPSSVTAKDALAALAASSGQDGTEQIVNTSIPEVALPAALAAKLPKPHAPLADEGGQSVVHLYRITGLQLHTSQSLRETTRGAIRIIDEEGMSVYNTMRFPVQPGAQRLCIHHLRVLDPSGRILGEANLKDHYSLDAAGAGMAVSGKVIHLPVPGLKPGCTIDYEYTIENSGTARAIEYTRHVFAQAEPCRLDAWFITGDTARMKFASSRNLKPERDGDSLVWLETKPAVLNSSALLSGDDSSLPVLHAGTPSASWERLGRDYLDQIRDRLAVSDPVTTAAQDAIAGLSTPRERIASLSSLVREGISYTAIEFGARAVIPNPAAATLANRYGDCKDQAVLLHQLFAAAAIPSFLCVINSRGDIHRDFPCLAQFDHMIVALVGEDGKSLEFIDPTNKYLEAVPGSAPVGLENRTALILDPAGPRLAQTPPFSPPSDILAKRDITLRARQDAVLTDTITITGTRAARLRALLAPLPPLDRTAAIRSLIAFDRLSHHVKDIRIQNIKELQSPLRITIQWEARRVLHSVDGKLRLALPTIVESHLIAPGSGDSEDEERPLRFNSSIRLRSETSLQMPPGHLLVLPSNPSGAAESAFGKWTLAVSPPDAKRTARINWDCSLNAGAFPGAQRRAFIDFTHNSLRQLEGEWEFTPETVAKP
jgi:tetratricopeptide (TPR) repeat protein